MLYPNRAQENEAFRKINNGKAKNRAKTAGRLLELSGPKKVSEHALRKTKGLQRETCLPCKDLSRVAPWQPPHGLFDVKRSFCQTEFW